MAHRLLGFLFLALSGVLRRAGLAGLAAGFEAEGYLRLGALQNLDRLLSLSKTFLKGWDLDRVHRISSEALKEAPDHPRLLNNLGLVALHRGEHEQAADLFRRASERDPAFPQPLNNLGVVALERRDYPRAEVLFRRTVERFPDYPDGANNLALSIRLQGRLEEAEAILTELVRRFPDHGRAWNNLGAIAHERGDLARAVEHYRQAVTLEPDLAEAHIHLATILDDPAAVQPAMAYYRTRVFHNPGDLTSLLKLAMGHLLLNQWEEAADCYDRILEQVADHGEALSGKAMVAAVEGRGAEALAFLARAVEQLPDRLPLRSGYLFHLHYDHRFPPEEIFAQGRKWAERVEAKQQRLALSRPAGDGAKRLKVGYLSPDFRKHSVAFFLEPLLAHHDPEQVEIFCYADVAHPDRFTRRFEEYAHYFRQTFLLDHRRLAERIMADGIDILVDLAGHTTKNRLELFAMKPAPIQVTYLGYPDSSCLAAMDYRFTDAFADPPGMTEHLHTEELVRIDPCFLCFSPHPESPEPRPEPPCVEKGRVTFASFNNPMKISDATVEAWAGVLERLPNSRLLLKNNGFRFRKTRGWFEERFAARGIARDRIWLVGFVPDHAKHFSLYDAVDIALDPYPDHGTTTTCEALWMGVPVVTLAGRSHVSRVGVSLLANVGLDELVAGSWEEYQERAVALAADPERLASLRRDLRRRIRESPLMDGASLARRVEEKYRWMWQRLLGEGRKDDLDP